MTPHLSIIIPAYNEALRIKLTLEHIDVYIRKQSYTVEVIVVINNTTDDTLHVVSDLQQKMPYLQVVDIGMHIHESGTKGLAVAHGMLLAKGQYRLFMDADNATELVQIEKFWKYFNKGYDIVFGSRYIRGARAHRVWYRNIMGKLSNVVVQVVLLLRIRDTQCGFKCFTAKAAQEIFEESTVAGWGFDIELFMLARKFGYKVREVPIVWREIGRSSVKAGAYISTLRELFYIRKLF